MVGEPVGKMIGIGQLVHRCWGGFDRMSTNSRKCVGRGASSEKFAKI